MLHVSSANETGVTTAGRSPRDLDPSELPSLLSGHFNLSDAELRSCNRYMVAHERDISRSKATEMPKACFKGFACAKKAKKEKMVLRSGRWVTLQQAAEWEKAGKAGGGQ